VFGLFLLATVASLLIVSAIPVSQSTPGPRLDNSKDPLPPWRLRVLAPRPARPAFPLLQLPGEFAFERALEAYEELIDATCATRRG